jgi:phospholipid/cholesterol/gamma-HCH transport system substrate-binding protein
MKHDNINYFVVGTFVLSMLAALLVVLGLITGRTGDRDEYHTTYDNVSGLAVGTAVSYEGFTIGQVDGISPIHGNGRTRYKVEFGVMRQADGTPWPIPADSVARIVSAGLLSAVTIDIEEGGSPRFHAPGEEIAGSSQRDLFGALADAAGSLNELTTTSIKPLIDDVGNSMRTVAAQAEQTVPQILRDLESIARRLNESAGQVNNLLSGENRLRVEEMFRHLDASLSRLDKLLNESTSVVVDNRSKINESVEELRRSVNNVSQYISEITFNLEATSRNMNEMSRQLRENPSLVIRGKPPRDAVDGQP